MSEPKSKDLEALYRSLSTLSRATVLSFADEDLSPLISMACTPRNQIRLMPAADLLSVSLTDFGDKAVEWLSGLRKGVTISNEAWWFSKISEVNFSDPIWFDLLRISTITQTVCAVKPESMLWMADSITDELLRSYCSAQGIPGRRISTTHRQSPRLVIIRAIGGWILNAFSDVVIFLLLSIGIRQTPPARELLLAGYPNNWITNENHMYYRFSGLLPRERQTAYLVSVTRQSLPRLRNPFGAARNARTLMRGNALAPILIIERYGSLVRLFWEYARAPFLGVRWWAGWLRQRHLVKWEAVDVWPLLMPYLTAAPIVDWPKNKYWRWCVASACKEQSAATVLIPLFELVEGRSAVAGVHRANARVIGLQHGPNGAAHHWRFDKALAQLQKESPSFMPDTIAVEGEVIAENLIDAGLDSVKVCIVGAPRITVRTPIFDCQASKRCILVLGEMHDPKLTFKIAKNLGLRLPDWRIFLRPHPATEVKLRRYLDHIVASAPQVFCLSHPQKSLEEELATQLPRALLVGVSGACVAAAKAGWPVVIAKSNWIPNFNPLLQCEKEPLLTLSIDINQGFDRFIRTVGGAELEHYSKICVRVGERAIAAESDEAVIRMAQAFNR